MGLDRARVGSGGKGKRGGEGRREEQRVGLLTSALILILIFLLQL